MSEGSDAITLCGICAKPDEGAMVQCDDCDRWFHFDCAKVLPGVEHNDWVCSECASNTTTVNIGTQEHGDTDKTAEHQIADFASSVAQGISVNPGKYNSVDTSGVELELSLLEEERQANLIFLQKKYNILQRYHDASHKDAKESFSVPNKIAHTSTNATIANTQEFFPRKASSTFTFGGAQTNKVVERNKESAQGNTNVFQLGRGTQVSFENEYFRQGHGDRGLSGFHDGLGTGGRCEGYQQGGVVGEVMQPSSLILKPEQLQARHTVPKELPTFSGRPEEWPIFISSYENSTRICGFSNDENLLRLQRALKGKAFEYVCNQLLIPSLVPEVISTLRMVFGRPEYIINGLLEQIRSSPGVNANKLDTLVHFSLQVKNLTATMEAAELLSHINNPILLQDLINKLSPQLRLDWALFSKRINGPNLMDFSQWLYDLGQAASSVSNMPLNLSQQDEKRKAHRVGFHEENPISEATMVKANLKEVRKCSVCAQDHFITICSQFKAMTYNDKWNVVHRMKLCRSCLKPHNPKFCKERKNCGVDRCTMKHHFLLHKPEVNKGTTSEQIIVAVHHMKTSNVLYRVLPITIYSQQAAVNVFALLDDGSGPTIIEQTIVQQLQLKGEESELCLRWTDGSTRVEKKSALVNLQVSAMGKNKKFTLSDVRTVNKLDLPPQSLMMQELSKKYSHLKGLPVQSYENAVPQIIIGLNNKHVAMPMKFREGKIDEPAATKTRLGWTVYGVLESVHRRSPHNLQLHICECDNDIALQKLMIENMTLESAGMNDKTREQENSSYNEKLENVIKRTGNHFTTKLLWRSNNISLPDNFGQAMSRLICFEKKLNNDQDLKTRVNALVQSMEDKKYIRKLSAQECKEQFKRKWYLPIFSVNNPNKPNKTRVVWDAAASYNGVSLNSCLEKGPDLLRPLLYVLFNFRIGRIGICGDICDMFHRVSVFEEDQHSQRFLWRNGEMDRAPDTYVLQVLSFGASCSPSIAQYVRNKNAQDFAEEFPRAAKSITERHYVDDMLDSADTEQEAIQLVKDVIEVHKRGNFFIRGWLSNSAQVTDAVGDTCVEETFCNAGKLVDHVVEPDKVLGLWWQTSNDVFTFNTKFTKASNEILCHEKIPTKRELLRLLMSIFDPLGFLAFYTIRVRILLQSIWRSGIEWDDPIPAEFVNAWKQWLSLFRRVSEVQVPRCYFDNIRRKDCKIELHLFVDASESACAAVAYFRIENANNVHIALVSSKTKVAPLRPVSIPRMELIAAVLGSRLAKAITTGHDLKIHDSHYYTDSKTVLTWLRSDPRKYKQFVMFRIAEVQENTDITKWQYIQSKQNVADAATKWKSTNEFGPASSWFSGPEFLLLPKEQRPKHEMPADVDYEQDCETKLEPHFVAVQVEVCSIVDTSRFSKWERLERCMAYVKRFIDNCKKSIRKNEQIDSVIEKSTNLTADDLLWSQHFLYHLAQAEAYKNEIEKLKENSQYRLPKTSPLKKLSPFIDEFGILRLRGRLENAPIQDSTKNPIILPKRHHITHLVVNWYHRKFRHVHHDTVANEIFQMFYISSLRRILRSVRKNCQHCKLRSANPTPPEMGQLPEARLSPYTRPFTHVGIDFFGPFFVTFGRRTEKRYGVLFTCMTCRAIHLEIAHSLTMNSCVMAIRNFISRSGTPTQIFSDNGTNLVAAEKELREAHRQLDFNTLQAQFVTAHTKWTFIPPASPHMGGAWERLIRSVKNVLYQIVTPETKLSDEKLYNLFLEIESIVNSRPLTYLSLDTAEHEALTPNHFLLGSSNGKPSLGEFCAKDQYVRSSWRHSQFLAEKFWKRWVTEILPTLTRRTKWHDKTKAIEKGDVVVIVDPNLPRYSWPKGIITSTYPGKDGQVRSVTVRTATGEYHRPSTKIAVLDVKSKIPPKAGQKRPATSPAPLISSPHHLQSPSTQGGGGTVSGSGTQTQNAALVNHNSGQPSNLMGAQSPSIAQQQHQAHQQAVAAAAVQAQQQMVGVSGGLNSAAATSARGPFAAALRNLAKQADIKEEDDGMVRDRNDRTVPPGAVQPPIGIQNASPVVQNSNPSRTPSANDRLSSSGSGPDERSAAKKRSAPSPQPAEKIARLNPSQAATMQPELLARSGFQPYRSDERLLHPAGAFQIDAYSPFAGIPGMPPGAFLNPAGLPYPEQLYLDQRYQMLRAAGAHHSHPHALYPAMASPYASHLYSMIPGAALGIGPALHERMKLEEEHRARIAREEEREREMQREKERELREQREREREQREKEQREREQREKEQREKEQKEKEAREREIREKEREARERERQQLLSASHHYSNQLYSPLNRNLLGSMIPHLNLGLRPPPTGLHGLPAMSPYHSTNQRQSPHGMSLNLGLPGLPSLSHGPPNLPHHLQQAAMGLGHPAAAGLGHPGFSAAALGLSHHGLNLTHPHMSPHHPAITSAHQIQSHSSPVINTSTAVSSPHSLNLSASSAGMGTRHSEPNTITSSAPSLQAPNSIAQPTSALAPNIPSISSSLYYAHHPTHHLAAMHAAASAASGMSPSVAHQQNSAPLSLSLTGANHSLSASPTSMKIPTPASSGGPPMSSMANTLNQNGGRASSSPHAMRHHVAAAAQHASQEKPSSTAGSNLAPSTHEPATLDLTGSNSNSSNPAPSTTSSIGVLNPRGTPSIAQEVNGVESSAESSKDSATSKDDPLKSTTPPTVEKNPPTPVNAATIPVSTTNNIMLPVAASPEDIRRNSPNSGSQPEAQTAISTTNSNSMPASTDEKSKHLLSSLGRSNSAEEASAL